MENYVEMSEQADAAEDSAVDGIGFSAVRDDLVIGTSGNMLFTSSRAWRRSGPPSSLLISFVKRDSICRIPAREQLYEMQ
ncbi:hypothetical protein ACFU44_16840 [Nocardia rhizosphaerihabitans]|uniref:hypothetical protein n=1 Tax=Nocardia rhizosphaerihabitans TaxID=1691570 RepID=UPI00366EE073